MRVCGLSVESTVDSEDNKEKTREVADMRIYHIG